MKQNQCNICNTEFDSIEEGVIGFFGIIPVTFCENCLVGIRDLAESMCSMCNQDE